MAHKIAMALEGQLRLAVPPSGVRRVLDLMGSIRVLTLYAPVNAALAGD